MSDLSSLKSYLTSIGCGFSENESMKLHTSFKIGGPADVFITPNSEEVLRQVVVKCKECEVPFHVIGCGSNILVSDLGISGAVIYSGGLNDISYKDIGQITCSAGTKLSRLCSFALEKSLTGLEFAWGIPGSAGGAVFMNAGAYDSEMKNVVSECTYLNKDCVLVTDSVDKLELGYRKSIFQKNNGIILSVKYQLQIGAPNEIRYKMDDLINRRKTKQPLEYPSAGSTFKRPTGYYAGTLIQECGLKGVSVGGAMVSEKHSGFVINTGNATCDDVMKLIDIIKETVYKKAGVELECEVRIIR